MMRIVRKIIAFTIPFLFSIYICICVIGAIPATAQSYFPFPSNPLNINLFGGSQVMPVSNPLFSSNYQSGQAWNPFGSNITPSFGVIPVGYYSGSTQTKEMAEGQLIVYLNDQVQIEQHPNGSRTNIPELNALMDRYGIYEIEASSSGGFYVLKFSKSHAVNDVRRAFEDLTDYVESAEPNLVRKAHSSSGINTMMGMPGPMMGISGPMIGGWPTQASSFTGLSFTGQGFPYTGTGIGLGSWMPTTQPYYSGFQFPQLTSIPGLNYGSSWLSQGLSSMQPSFNQWQQTTWGRQQPYYNINPFPLTGNWL